MTRSVRLAFAVFITTALLLLASVIHPFASVTASAPSPQRVGDGSIELTVVPGILTITDGQATVSEDSRDSVTIAGTRANGRTDLAVVGSHNEGGTATAVGTRLAGPEVELPAGSPQLLRTAHLFIVGPAITGPATDGATDRATDDGTTAVAPPAVEAAAPIAPDVPAPQDEPATQDEPAPTDTTPASDAPAATALAAEFTVSDDSSSPVDSPPVHSSATTAVDVSTTAADSSTAAAETVQYPVILVHGTWSSVETFDTLAPALEEAGYTVYTYNYGMVEGLPYNFILDPTGEQYIGGEQDIDSSTEDLAEMIERVKTETGAEKVNLIGSSQGGLIIKNYLSTSTEDDVANVVDINATNHGTTLGGLAYIIDTYTTNAAIDEIFAPIHDVISAVNEGINEAIAPEDPTGALQTSVDQIADLTDDVVTLGQEAIETPINVVQNLLRVVVAELIGPAAAQQAIGSDFITHLNSTPDTKPGVNYLVLSTTDDTTSTPYDLTYLQAGPGSTVLNLEEHNLPGVAPDDVISHASLPPAAVTAIVNYLNGAPVIPGIDTPSTDDVSSENPGVTVTIDGGVTTVKSGAGVILYQGPSSETALINAAIDEASGVDGPATTAATATTSTASTSTVTATTPTASEPAVLAPVQTPVVASTEAAAPESAAPTSATATPTATESATPSTEPTTSPAESTTPATESAEPTTAEVARPSAAHDSNQAESVEPATTTSADPAAESNNPASVEPEESAAVSPDSDDAVAGDFALAG